MDGKEKFAIGFCIGVTIYMLAAIAASLRDIVHIMQSVQ